MKTFEEFLKAIKGFKDGEKIRLSIMGTVIEDAELLIYKEGEEYFFLQNLKNSTGLVDTRGYKYSYPIDNEHGDPWWLDFIEKVEKKKELVKTPYTFETFPPWALWARSKNNINFNLLIIGVDNVAIYIGQDKIPFNGKEQMDKVEISPDRIHWFPFYREGEKKESPLICSCCSKELQRKYLIGNKQLKYCSVECFNNETMPWFENIPEQGVLCWAKDMIGLGPVLKRLSGFRGNVCLVRIKSYNWDCQFCDDGNISWASATPLTREEIEKFLPKEK